MFTKSPRTRNANVMVAALLLGTSQGAIGCDAPEVVPQLGAPTIPEPPAKPDEQDKGQTGQHVLTDQEITAAVERELFSDPAAQSYKTTVQSTDGIVALTGTVDNLLAKERSGRLASVVKGVRGVSNQIEVAPPKRDDEELAADVRQALLADPAADSYEIEVSATNQNIVLEGDVDSFQELSLAETLAKGVSGVRSVDNRITLTYPAQRPDVEVAADVESALRWDALVDERLIDVRVDDGKVKLSGTVGSIAERTRAYEDAWVNGVTDVATELGVEWWARNEAVRKQRRAKVTDDEIEKAVGDQLMVDPRVSPFEVDVSVEQGIVTLTGEVSTIKAKKMAGNLATHTTGVLAVDNDIEVDAPTALSDAMLEMRLSAALVRSPILGALDIKTSVDDGVVTLSGDVPHFATRAEAEDIVEGIAGVEDVINALVVTHPSSAFLFDPYAYPDRPIVRDEEYSVTLVPLHSDFDLADAIREQIRWSPFVDPDQVRVSVENGVATLRGEVDSPAEEASAIENAFEGGAIRVNSELTIASE